LPLPVRLALVLLLGCAQHPPVVDPGCLQSTRPATVTRTGSYPPRDARTIASVRVSGADPALAATLAKVIETHPGDTFANAHLADDIRKIWALDLVADVQIEARGGEVTFAVTPQPLIDRVMITRDAYELARIRALAGTPFDATRITRMADYIEQGFVHDGYLDAKVRVTHRRWSTASDRAAGATIGVCVAAEHGPRITIRKLGFPGRRDLDERTLLAEVHGGDDVNHPGGVYDADMLSLDILRIKALYWNRGKANVAIREPKIERHGASVDVSLPIEEGPTFRYGPIAVAALGAHRLAIRPGQQFSRDRVVATIAELEAHTGASVLPVTRIDLTTNTIAITFEVTWNHLWQAVGSLPRH
jgi:outer membrane protein insertion porin family